MAEQKLNIVFTGDVSQLNKAIQSAEAELTAFENKLKDSLGTEAFASINQSVDNLRNKFKTLSSIDIKANPQQALTAINEVLTGVAKIKSSEVLLKANNKEALAAITQVESFVKSIRATIDVGFDSSEITGKIADLKGRLTGLEADVSVKVTGLDKLNAEILEVRSELNELTNKKIFIDTDTSKAQERIKILEAQLLRLEKISVSPDITIESKGRVDTLAADIQKRLSVLRAEVEITADSSELDTSISNLKSKLASLEAQVKVDSVGLEQVNADLLKTRSLINTFEEIKIVVDSGDTIAEINRIEKELAELQAFVISPEISETQLDLFKRNIDSLKIKLSELRKIPVSLDTSGIGAAIDAIKAKALSVFEIDISADPSKALAAIDAVQSDIDEIRKNKILLEADSAPALAAIDKIEGELKGLKATISVDGSGLTSAIDSIKSRSLSVLNIDINANPEKAIRAIDVIQSQIDEIRNSKLLLDADNAPALAAIDKIEGELQNLKAKITIDPSGFDTSKLQSLITPLSQRVELKVNTKVAEAEITNLLGKVRDLKGQDILINLDGTQVVKTIDAIEKELLQLQANLKKATDPREVARLNQSLLQLRNSLSGVATNQFTSNVNRAQNATFAFSQVLREAPAFAFSAQTGILALSNNLPILADRFKEARAAGLSTGAIFKDMAKSLVSLPGLLTIASTAAVFLAGAFNKSGQEAKETAREIKSALDIIGEATDSTAGDIAQVQALVKAFGDTSSFEKQKRILSELKGINESYFGQLQAGKTTFEEITKAANDYTNALINQAIVEGLKDEITELSKQIRAATKEYTDLTKRTDAARKATDNFNVKAVSGERAADQQASSINDLNSNYKKLSDRLQDSAKKLGGLRTQFNSLTDELRSQILISLDFKSPSGAADDFRDETEDILSRAKAFQKQFGDVFVTPDLDESFTNTKDIILKSAKQLLDDIKNLNLKIKLPVQVVVETDFITIDQGTPISQAELDNLRANYLEGLRNEFQEPLVIDLTIQPAVDVQKAKDRFKQAIKDANFEEALKNIDATPQLPGFKELDESIQTMAKSVNETLTPAFQNFFDALVKGESPIKAFFDSVIQSINQLIKKLIQAAIQAAILSALSGGKSSFGKVFTGLLGLGGGNQANFGFGGSSSLRALDVNITGSVIQRGTDTIISFNNSGRSLGRIQ